MLNPGWLQVGVWLRSKKYHEDWFVIHRVVPEIIELEGPYPKAEFIRAKVEYLHSYYLAPKYFECDDCKRKPGSPTLCADCLKRRKEFYDSGEHHCELPRFCSNPFLRYDDCWLPMEGPKYTPPIRVSRYRRSWLI